MNPRHTRQLMFVLLTALMLVVVVAALLDRAEAAPSQPRVTISDPRVTESSGLAVSTDEPGLAYTVNDSGNAAEVFAIDLASGDVVGVTTVRAQLRDVEALALRDGTLWIADVGDNRAERDDTALYAIDEPGRRTATVGAERHPVRLPGGPADVEALLAAPDSDELVVVTKALAGAEALSVRESELGREPATFTRVATDLPALVTDGSFSPDGSRVALLSYGALWTVDPADWNVVGSQSLPPLRQAETVAFTADDTVVVGSEGEDSPLVTLVLDPEPASLGSPATVATDQPATEPTTEPTAAPAPADEGDGSRAIRLGGVGVAGVAVGALAAWRLRSRTRSAGSRRAIR